MPPRAADEALRSGAGSHGVALGILKRIPNAGESGGAQGRALPRHRPGTLEAA